MASQQNKTKIAGCKLLPSQPQTWSSGLLFEGQFVVIAILMCFCLIPCWSSKFPVLRTTFQVATGASCNRRNVSRLVIMLPAKMFATGEWCHGEIHKPETDPSTKRQGRGRGGFSFPEGSILEAFFSTFLGVVLLAAAKSFAFRTLSCPLACSRVLVPSRARLGFVLSLGQNLTALAAHNFVSSTRQNQT